MNSGTEILTIVTIKECIFYKVPLGIKSSYMDFEQKNFKVKNGRPIGESIFKAFLANLSGETRSNIKEVKRIPMDVGSLNVSDDLKIEEQDIEELQALNTGAKNALKNKVKIASITNKSVDSPKKKSFLNKLFGK